MLSYLTAGESHGPQLTAIISGLPANLPVNIEQVNFQLHRRQKGYGRGGRMKIEQDQAELVSGVRSGFTMGGPVTLVVKNRDWVNWEEIMHPTKPVPAELGLREARLAHETRTPRPGHADLPGGVKWDHHDLRNVLERASARETAARVAVGSLGRQLLEQFSIEFGSHVVRIGAVALDNEVDLSDLERVRKVTEESEVRCLDSATAERMVAEIHEARTSRDSVGGVVEVIVRGLPIGLGGFAQWYDRLDGRLAQALMSIHSVKGVEIGDGFASASARGSAFQDEIFYKAGTNSRKKDFYRQSNHAGGLEGGITNGEDLRLHIAAKPISTLNRPLRSVNVETKKSAEAMVERTDNCVVPALCVVCEAVIALVLADAFLTKFGADNMAETRRNFDSFLSTTY